MNKALKDYKQGKIAKDYAPVNVEHKKDAAWCADGIFKVYWDKLKGKAKE